MRQSLKVGTMAFNKRGHFLVSARLRSRYHAGNSHSQYYLMREQPLDSDAPLYLLTRADAIPAEAVTPWILAIHMDLILDARALEEIDDDWVKPLTDQQTNYGQF